MSYELQWRTLILMSDEAITKPTLETVLERINDLRGEIVSLRTEFNTFREQVEVSLDRIESMTNLTRHEMLTLRMDFREIRAQFKQPT